MLQRAILACWEERVKILPVARQLGHTDLVDHVPELLDRIASRVVEGSSHRVNQEGAETAEVHAIQRYEQKFDLAAVVTELGMLRSCILLTIDAVHRQIPVAALRILDEAIDAIVTIARWFGTNTDVTEQRFLDEATKVLHSSLDYEETLQQIARLAVPDLADSCVVDQAHGGNLGVESAVGRGTKFSFTLPLSDAR